MCRKIQQEQRPNSLLSLSASPCRAQQLGLRAKLSFTITVISHFYGVLICNILGKDLSMFSLCTLLFPRVYNQPIKTYSGAKLAT